MSEFGSIILYKNEAQLRMAAQDDDVESLKNALANGADVNARDRHGWTSLMWAAAAGHDRSVVALNSASADINASTVTGTTALMIAAGHGHYKTARILIDSGANINAKSVPSEWTAIMWAASNKHLDCVKMCAEAGAKIECLKNDYADAYKIAKQIVERKELCNKIEKRACDNSSTGLGL